MRLFTLCVAAVLTTPSVFPADQRKGPEDIGSSDPGQGVNFYSIEKEIALGKHLTTLALSEKGSRSNFWAPVSQLTPVASGDGFTTTAHKSWVTAARHADSYVSSAQKPAAQSPLESTVYLIRRTAGRIAMQDALAASTPYLLEPIAHVTIHAPGTATSRVTSGG